MPVLSHTLHYAQSIQTILYNCVQGGAYPYYCSTDNTCYLNSSYCGGSSGGSTCGSGCGGYAGVILCTGTSGASGCSCGASYNCPTSCCGR